MGVADGVYSVALALLDVLLDCLLASCFLKLLHVFAADVARTLVVGFHEPVQMLGEVLFQNLVVRLRATFQSQF